MRVLVDARAVGSGRGVGRYAGRLLAAAAAGSSGARHDWHGVLSADAPGAGALPPAVTEHRTRWPGRVVHGVGALTGRPRLDRIAGGADVLWLPAPAPVAAGTDVPLVVTVHDLSFLRRPEDFTRYERLWHRAIRVDRLVQRAAAIVCDTRAVADEISVRWPAAGDRVHVVLPGVDRPPVAPAPPLPHGVPERFLLAVGALEPRKAPEVLLGAFAQARAAGLDAELVVVGRGRLSGLLDAPGVRAVGTVDDAVLHALYARALAVVMPSWLEGFGLPPLEAALHGTPSVVTDLPVFRETLGDGALRVPPGDAAALADALLSVAADEGRRAALGVAAASAAAPLTWERAGAALTAVLTAAGDGAAA